MALLESVKRVRRIAQSTRAADTHIENVQERFSRQWDELGGMSKEQTVVSGHQIVPSITFWLDEEQGRQDLICRSAPGGGINLKSTVFASGRWMGLHFGLGDLDLSRSAVLGYYSQQRSSRSCTWRVCLRSGTPDGFVDHFFDKHVVAHSGSSTQVDMLELQSLKTLPLRATWRELVVFFFPESFDVTLQDFRLLSA